MHQLKKVWMRWGGNASFHLDSSGALPQLVMPGLDPGIFSVQLAPMREGYVYIMTNRPNGVLYVGVTSNLARRAYEHREGLVEGFTSRYGLIRLAYYETFGMVTDAIQREKNIKHWPRAWKITLIETMNPEWRDLYLELG